MWVFNLLKACYSLSHLSDWVIVHCSHCGVTVVLQCHCACSCSSPKAPKKAASHLWSGGNQSQNFQHPSAYASNVVLTTQPTKGSKPRPSKATNPAEKLYIDYHCTTRPSLPRVCRSCSGQVTVVVLTLFPHTSRAADPMSSSVMRRTWPFLTWERRAAEHMMLSTVDNSVLCRNSFGHFYICFFCPRRWGVPQIEGVPTNSIEDGKHTRLKGVPEEHLGRWHLWFSTFSWGLF